jgi:hypothetical protein
MMQFQRATYEATAFLGPHVSALLAGFAVMLFGEIYLTPAGARYLEQFDHEAEA